MDNQQERQIFDIGWLVGIIDGEGCFSLSRYENSKHRTIYLWPAIIIANTNNLIIDKTVRILRANGISPYVQYKPSKKVNNKSYWSIQIKGTKRVKAFLDMIYQYLECRQPQALVLKEFVEYRLSRPNKEPYGDKEWEFFNRLRTLNLRGQIPESPETTRQTLATSEDIVRASLRSEEVDRNDQPAIAAIAA